MRCAPCAVMVVAALCLWSSLALAEDIMNVPTANQQKAGAIKLSYSSVDPHNPNPRAPSHTSCYKAFIGLTDRLELDARVVDPNHNTPAKTHWNATLLIIEETKQDPNLVLGVNDISQQYVYSAGPRAGQRADRAYFAAAAKTINPPARGARPQFPIWRVHLGYGTERHNGFFGGLQARLSPKIGAVAFYMTDDVQFAPDERAWVWGISYSEGPKWPTVQVGRCGRSEMICVSYVFAGK